MGTRPKGHFGMPAGCIGWRVMQDSAGLSYGYKLLCNTEPRQGVATLMNLDNRLTLLRYFH
jgi:hypothetical protein